MPELFRAYEANGTTVPTYFIESSAPDNVDDIPSRSVPPRQLKPIDADKAIDEIARHLSEAETPNLVIMVHGFNNPEADVLAGYAAASRAVERDPQLSGQRGLVCVGYRWPSEALFQPKGTYAALPAALRGVLLVGAGLCLIYLLYHLLISTGLVGDSSLSGHAIVLVGLFLITVVAAGVVLRTIVYFRDNYRAIHYGAPDLIEIIRQIDRAIIRNYASRPETDAGKRNNVQLSFIGHSMGALVVTNVIRVLSDLFKEKAIRDNLNTGVVKQDSDGEAGGEAGTIPGFPLIPNDLGRAFSLMRVVLASPDIPAECLLSNRANYLAASLHRFREAYLFSNEGDEVLRQISTSVNYFSFPTRNRNHGYRLGNVEILSSAYGIIEPPARPLLEMLRVGHYTLRGLYGKLRNAAPEEVQDRVPGAFSYFDCTDYVDTDNDGQKRSLLTFARQTKLNNPEARMSGWEHFRLLFAYVRRTIAPRSRPRLPNVHGGYFDGQFCQELIYRLACLGYESTRNAYGGREQLSDKCRKKQIRALLSQNLPRA
jgi:hypothetical protein